MDAHPSDIYVQEYFTDTLASIQISTYQVDDLVVGKKKLVSESFLKRLQDDLIDFAQKLSVTLSDEERISRNLETQSVPSSASLALYIGDRNTPERETSTDDPVPNVYIGVYTVKVAKQGYQSYEFQINLVEDTGTTIYCQFAKEEDKTETTNCKLE